MVKRLTQLGRSERGNGEVYQASLVPLASIT